MTSKFTNDLIDFFKSGVIAKVYKMWGGETLASMGDGVKFRVTKSPCVDYVYVRYLAGYEHYDVEFGALVGADYDVIDHISPVSREDLPKVISRRVFNFNVVDEPKVEIPKRKSRKITVTSTSG